MNNESLSILIEVAKLAQKAGLLSLEDAVLVKNAIDDLTKKDEE